MFLAVFEGFGPMAIVFSFAPRADVKSAIGALKCAFAFLVAVYELALVKVSARIHLLALAVLPSGDELPFVGVAIRIAFFPITVSEVIKKLAFKNCAGRGDLFALSVSLAILPVSIVIRTIRSGERPYAIAPTSCLVDFSLISAVILAGDERLEDSIIDTFELPTHVDDRRIAGSVIGPVFVRQRAAEHGGLFGLIIFRRPGALRQHSRLFFLKLLFLRRQADV